MWHNYGNWKKKQTVEATNFKYYPMPLLFDRKYKNIGHEFRAIFKITTAHFSIILHAVTVPNLLHFFDYAS